MLDDVYNNKIIELANIRKERNLNYEIEVDGGINSETAQICKDANADVLVAGSYIFSGGKEDYKKTVSYTHLRAHET